MTMCVWACVCACMHALVCVCVWIQRCATSLWCILGNANAHASDVSAGD